MPNMTEEEFADALRSVLSPSKAIDSEAHLKGRASALRDAKQAFSAHGRQVFVHGYRGIGKSSVALTTAKLVWQIDPPILVYCSRGSTFSEIIRDICSKALDLNPLVREQTNTIKGNAGIKIPGGILEAGGGGERATKTGGVPLPTSVNDAVSLLKASLGDRANRVIVIDEFDLLEDKASHQLFGEFVKLCADSGLNLKIIFCGVAQDLDEIFQAHPSTFRIFHPLKLEALKPQACLDIIADAEKALGVTVEHNSKMRIVQICDGFPYFVHLITEKLMWAWFNDPKSTGTNSTTPEQYASALMDACTAAEPELRLAYDSVVKKYSADGELVLWSLAEGSELRKNIDLIERDFTNLYDRIPDRLKSKKGKLGRSQLSSRLANMKRDDYRNILVGNGRGWYEFREKRMRGYARHRAASQEIDLRADHPLG